MFSQRVFLKERILWNKSTSSQFFLGQLVISICVYPLPRVAFQVWTFILAKVMAWTGRSDFPPEALYNPLISEAIQILRKKWKTYYLKLNNTKVPFNYAALKNLFLLFLNWTSCVRPRKVRLLRSKLSPTPVLNFFPRPFQLYQVIIEILNSLHISTKWLPLVDKTRRPSKSTVNFLRGQNKHLGGVLTHYPHRRASGKHVLPWHLHPVNGSALLLWRFIPDGSSC